MYRDRVRCESMERNGYHVYTLDNKQGSGSSMQIVESKITPVCIRAGRHCNANFCDIRRFYESIERTWGTHMRFDTIILDYFFSPVSTSHIILITKLFHIKFLCNKEFLDGNTLDKWFLW